MGLDYSSFMSTQLVSRYSSFLEYTPERPKITEAIVISAFCGDQYYSSKASELSKALSMLCLDYEILEIQFEGQFSWVEACKAKSSIFIQMLNRHNRPIFWVDIDTNFHSKPHCLDPGCADFGAFLRNFKAISEYDPYVFGRIFHPGYLLFNNTKRAISFAKELAAKAAESGDDVTDDFVLHEVFKYQRIPLNIMIFDPSLIKPIDSKPSALSHGDSGNVNKYKNKVKQHAPKVVDTGLISKYIYDKSQSILRNGSRDQCAQILNYFPELRPMYPPLHSLLLLCIYKSGHQDRFAKTFTSGLESPELLAVSTDFLSKYLPNYSDKKLSLLRLIYDKAHTHNLVSLTGRLKALIHSCELDERAARSNLPMAVRPRLWWWNKPYPGNLGDIINPYLAEKISGVPPLFCSSGKRIFAIGSILPHAKDKDVTVWGSGSPRSFHEVCPRANYLAVRGPLSREIILKNGGSCPEIYGDPALLLPRYYQPLRNDAANQMIGLVLHHYHSLDGLTYKRDQVKPISVLRVKYSEIEKFIDEIAGCSFVISTSLHGIIIAHAYGVPAVWCTLTGQEKDVPGDGTKFYDYFASVGICGVHPIDLSELDAVDTSLYEYATLPVKLPNLDLLLEVCPFRLAPVKSVKGWVANVTLKFGSIRSRVKSIISLDSLKSKNF